MKTQPAFASSPSRRHALPFPVFPGGASLRPLQSPTGLISRLWGWFKARQFAHSSDRRLRVAATASLGEKRFVALIQIDDQQFLVGGGSGNVVLLAQVNAKEEFGNMLQENMSEPRLQPAKRASKPATRRPIVKPAAKLTMKPLVNPAMKLTVRPASKKPIKPAGTQTGRQTLKMRKQA
jgi:flagellar biogenesis protein FliO